MTVTTVLVWVMCAMQAGGCVATAGSPARTHSYRTLATCLDAAHAERRGTEILSCKPRHEILFEFEWTEEPGAKGKGQPI